MKKIWREYIPTTQIGIFDCIVNPPHIHKEVEIIYVTKGQMSINCEGRIHTLAKGDFSIVLPNQIHYYFGVDGEYEYLYLVTDVKHLTKYDSLIKGKVPEVPFIFAKLLNHSTVFPLLNFYTIFA